ncbi:tripartite motif-containing protein 16-like [Melanotaenia boesemani]|uniref:tripartite motif-containing protein 16-like n=1 Tax=Melanotaenia boesemani TaxID=1250792 RepID=UPI001C04078E|nr:tripartite motif-containing protein 16-like [Melanotaenia boesemani]
MAETQQEDGVGLDQGQFSCSVCLDLLKEPVTVQCGHSYCRGCIEGCWDLEEDKGQFSCPQCREIFQPRPILGKNHILAEVVEKLKGTCTQQNSSCAGPEDVACDFCIGATRNKASMSCLTCLASYCAAHLQPHHRVSVLKTHKLVSVTVPLHLKMCLQHNKLMEVYCRTDRRCICYLCTLDSHNRHSNISAAAERAAEQEQLILDQQRVQDRLEEREDELDELLQALKRFKSCSQTAVESIDVIIDELIAFLEKRRYLGKQMIEVREKAAIAQAEELQLQLEEEISKLRKRYADLEQLSKTDDHIHFIQTFQSLSTPCESPDLVPGAVVRPRHSMETVTKSVSELKNNIEDLIKITWPKISATVCAVDVVLPPVPKTREEFLRYCCTPTLDNNSVHSYLSISKENRRVTCRDHDMCYSHHSDRFPGVKQVLCREGLSERCYWEVTSTCQAWSVAVAYKSINRASEFGTNQESWSLESSKGVYTFRHYYTTTAVTGPPSSRIGVYLDYKAGILSFYSVSDETMTLLHQVQTSFTQPLYPGLVLKDDGSYSRRYAELVKLS